MENTLEPNEQHSIDIERAILEVKRERTEFINRKRANESDVSKLNHLLYHTKPSDMSDTERERVRTRKAALLLILEGLESDIRTANHNIGEYRKTLAYVNGTLQAKKGKVTAENKLVQAIQDLYMKHHKLSVDKMIRPALREASGGFANELQVIVEKFN